MAGRPSQDTVKCQFITREGTYKLFKDDTCRTTPPPPQINTPVKCSFIPSSATNGDLICFNVDKELYVCNYRGIEKATDLNNPIDKRSYKGLYPTCHDFNQANSSADCVYLLVGLSAGQIQLIDPIKKEISKLYNEERAIDKTKVTCIKWVPNSVNLFLVSHSSGQLYVYKEDLPCGSTAPHYQIFKQGEGYAIYTCKTKSTRNPLYRWVIGEGSINEIAFSPCSKYLATVSQDGFLRVFNYDTMELVGRVRSYFGGLLCVCWSPDSKFIVTGGEDDLITVWSLNEKRVIARGQGHKSWVSVVAFDPYTTIVRDMVDSSGGISAVNDEESRNDLNDSTHLLQATSTSSTTPSIVKTNRNSPTSIDKSTNHLTPTTTTTTTTIYRNKSPISNASSNNNSSSSSIITSYRFGSVGQDTQLCFWELTEDIIKQPVGRSRTSILLHSPTNGSNQQQSNLTSTPFTPTITAPSTSLGYQSTNCSSLDRCHNLPSSSVVNCLSHNCNYLDPGNVYANHAASTISSSTSSKLTPTLNVNNSSSSTTSSAGGKHGEGSSGSGMTTLTKKEHKRNFSLASRNSDKNSLNKSSHSKLNDDPIRLLGTTICPRLDEVPLLEPLICKKIAHERLTSLVFKEDCFIVACQEGFIFTWIRPNKWEEMQIVPSPIPSIEEESAMVNDNESTVV